MFFRSTVLLFFLGCPFLLQAETHEFRPEIYWRELSNHMEPALRIRPGDRVVTTCVDSNGDDEKGLHVTKPYNPLTGPFYVEGAEPGDTLIVRLQSIRLNRGTGIGSTRISPAVLTAESLTGRDNSSRTILWKFDFDRMTAETESFPGTQIQLQPFPGTIGVAPADRQGDYTGLMGRTGFSASSITADSHGGNVDYNRLVEGSRLYFPVFVTGAYLFLGDGHAAQGDGETSGGAIETSLQVEFHVALEKGKKIPAMRAESQEYYMAMGMGRPLDAALQKATVNMLHWLTVGHGLGREEAQVLLGSSVEYDIAAVTGPVSTVVCKVRKDSLGSVDRPW